MDQEAKELEHIVLPALENLTRRVRGHTSLHVLACMHAQPFWQHPLVLAQHLPVQCVHHVT